MTELSEDTGSEWDADQLEKKEDELSTESMDVDENNFLTIKEQQISVEQNVLNQTEILVKSHLIDADSKVEMLAQKIRDLVTNIELKKQIIQKLIQLNVMEQSVNIRKQQTTFNNQM